jgi:hypothetical protein
LKMSCIASRKSMRTWQRLADGGALSVRQMVTLMLPLVLCMCAAANDDLIGRASPPPGIATRGSNLEMARTSPSWTAPPGKSSLGGQVAQADAYPARLFDKGAGPPGPQPKTPMGPSEAPLPGENHAEPGLGAAQQNPQPNLSRSLPSEPDLKGLGDQRMPVVVVPDASRQSYAVVNPLVPPPPPPSTPPPNPALSHLALPLHPGDVGYAVETVRCEGPAGVWAMVYKGQVAQVDKDKVSLQVTQRYGFRYHPAAEGYNKTDWYCVPRRRYCFSRIGFMDWGGRYKEGELGTFDRDASFPAAKDLINGMKPILAQRCP